MLAQTSPAARCILLFYWRVLIIYPGARAVSEAASYVIKLIEREAPSTLIAATPSGSVEARQRDAFKPLWLL